MDDVAANAPPNSQAKRYVEASPKARLFFLVAILSWLALLLFLDRFNVWFPVHGTPTEKLVKTLDRGLVVLIVSVSFWLMLSTIMVFEAIWTVRSRQWPPHGHPMPFRTPVKEIKHPLTVWLFAGSIVAMYMTHIVINVASWSRVNKVIHETISLLERPQGKCGTTVPEQEKRTGCFGGRER